MFGAVIISSMTSERLFRRVSAYAAVKSGLNLSILRHEDYAESFTKFRTVWHEIQCLWEDVLNERKAYKGYPAPDVPVVPIPEDSTTNDSKGFVETQLLSYARPGVPLVINFGSCT